MNFVDTSFWYALQTRRDQHHADAVAMWSKRSRNLLTTSLVLGETWTLLRTRLGFDAAVRFLERVSQLDRLDSVHVDERQEAAAWRWLRTHAERPYSFVDATSFAVMRSRRVRQVLTFDGDFLAAGFAPLQPA